MGVVVRLSLLAFAISHAPAHGGSDPATRLKDHVRVLASDAYQGRGPTEPGEMPTLDYIAGAFKRAGLQGGGPTGDFLQPVPLKVYRRETPAVLIVEGKGWSRVVTSGHEVTVTSRLAQTALVRAPLVFAGFGVVAPEAGWDDYADVDMRGKVAVVLANDPDFDKSEGPFGGAAPTIHGKVSTKIEAARKAGAAGLLIVHSQPASRISWQAYQAADSDAVWDLDRGQEAFGMRGWISHAAASDIFAAAGFDLTALREGAARRGFRAVPLADAVLSTQFATNSETRMSHNVVAYLPGATHPTESVVLGAHWDAYGVAPTTASDTVTGDRIRNGAVDNAVGVAQLIELAGRLAAGPRPDRSVVFVAYTAEEKDMLGSAFYAANPTLPLATTVAALNLDPHQVFGASRNVELLGRGLSDLDAVLEKAAADQGLAVDGDASPEAGWWLRSDHVSFALKGVPALYFRMGRDLATGGLVAGRAISETYMRERYHRPNDSFDDGWDVTSAEQETNLAEAVVRSVANGNQWPQWREAGAAFQSVRTNNRTDPFIAPGPSTDGRPKEPSTAARR